MVIFLFDIISEIKARIAGVFVEACVDILQSVQPEANDSSALKEKFGYYK